jgi:hypothetical protein
MMMGPGVTLMILPEITGGLMGFGFDFGSDILCISII